MKTFYWSQEYKGWVPMSLHKVGEPAQEQEPEITSLKEAQEVLAKFMTKFDKK